MKRDRPWFEITTPADNVYVQPSTRNTYIIEDDTFGEIWACLPDGTDRSNSVDGTTDDLTKITGWKKFGNDKSHDD